MRSFSQILDGARSLFTGGLRELHDRPAEQLPALDALRSFAILLVVGTHWGIPEYLRAGGVPSRLQQNPLIYFGWVGVDLFFILSGYLIGRQLWRELERTGTVRIGRFLLRRGMRIWPLYYALLAYYALTSPVVHPRLSDWTFLSNYLPNGMARSWTLSTEEQFYIAVPVLLWLLRKRVPLARFAWVLAGIELTVLVVRKITMINFLAHGGVFERSDFVLVTPFHTHMEGLLAGLAIALISVVRPHWLQRRSASGVSWTGLAVFAAATTLALILRVVDHRLFAHLSLGLIFGGLAFWALGDRSWLSRPLRAWVFYPISRLSYGMYLNHYWAIPSSNKAMVSAMQGVTDNPDIVFGTTLIGGTLISIGVAVVTFLLIEHPFLVLRDRRLARGKSRETPPESVAAGASIPSAAG